MYYNFESYLKSKKLKLDRLENRFMKQKYGRAFGAQKLPTILRKKNAYQKHLLFLIERTVPI